MVCKQNASKKASQTSFTSGTTVNTLGKLHWGSRMESFRASTSEVSEVVANRDVWRCSLELLPPQLTLTDMSGFWKKKKIY